MSSKIRTIIILFFAITAISTFLIYSFVSSKQPIVTFQKAVKGISQNALYIPNNYTNYGQPSGLTIANDGSIWYMDIQNTRLVHVSISGEILRTIGRNGTDQGEFSDYSNDVTIDNQGNLYVIGRGQCYKFDSNGGYVKVWGATDDEANFQEAEGIAFDPTSNTILITEINLGRILRFTLDGEFIAKYGSEGSGDGQLSRPRGLAVDSDGDIYVADLGNQRVMVFDALGVYKMKFGTPGYGDGEFNNPTDVAIAANGNIYVVAQDIPKIQVFDSAGNWQFSFGVEGTSAWELQSPYGIGIDSEGNLWISNWGSRALQRFSPTGVFISSVRNSGNVGGRLAAPMDVGFDSLGNLYVLDNIGGGGRVQKFTNAGIYLDTIVTTGVFGRDANILYIDKNDRIYVTSEHKVTVFNTSGTILFEFGTEGTGDGQFEITSGIAVDSSNNIYVADKGNSRIQKFDVSGNYLTQWGSHGLGHGEFCFSQIATMLFDSNDLLYVADNCVHNPAPLDGVTANTRVEVYNTNGEYQKTIGGFDRDVAGKFFIIQGMTIDSLGRLNVSDFDCKIQIFDLEGNYISNFEQTSFAPSCGGGTGELARPRGLTLNPVTNRVAIADTDNNRVQLVPSGTRIYNLIASADVVSNSESMSLARSYFDPTAPGVNNLSSSMYFGGYLVSDFTVNLTTNRDWKDVNVLTSPELSTSLVVNLNPTTAPGVSTTHTLYTVKKDGQTSIRVCPEATSMEEITDTCVNGYSLAPGATLSTVSIEGIDYWKVIGLTGTGILGLNAPTPTPTATSSPTPSPTQTVPHAPTSTATPTMTGTAAATPTVSLTTTLPPTTSALPSPTPKNVSDIIQCPVFIKFAVNSTVVKRGESVTFSWSTKNTEVVRSVLSEKDFNPVDTFKVAPQENTVISFLADNGTCTAKKESKIYVVDSLPWNNTLSIGSGVLLVEAAVALQQPAAFGNLWLAFASLINRRKKRTWGYVYDALSKKPLARAVVRLIRASDKVTIDTVVSEANGSIKLTPKLGSYLLAVSHPHYTFPSKNIVADYDNGYTNIYREQVIEIKSLSDTILFSIPGDPNTLSDSEMIRIRARKLFEAILEVGSTLLLIFGFSYSIAMSLYFPHLWNYLIFAFYSLAVLVKILLLLATPKIQGTVTNIQGDSLQGLELGIFDVAFNNLLYRTFTSSEGLYSFVVPNANYRLKILDTRYRIMKGRDSLNEIAIQQAGQESVRVIAEDITIVEK